MHAKILVVFVLPTFYLLFICLDRFGWPGIHYVSDDELVLLKLLS